MLEERKAVYRAILEKLHEKPPAPVAVKRPRKAVVGDIFEIPLADGRYAYGQYIHECNHFGVMVQIFGDFHESPIPVSEINLEKQLFPPVFCGLAAAIRSGDWKVIGHVDIKDFHYPLFRAGNADKNNKIHRWWIWDGFRYMDAEVPLAEEYRKLEMPDIWGYELLRERILVGRLPLIDVD